MGAEVVVDASVIAAALFPEAGSAQATAFLLSGPSLVAPELISVELASVAAKKVWRGETTVEVATRAVAAVAQFVDELVACAPLCEPALAMAAEHRLSAYDGLYLALAIRREARLATLDRRLLARVAEARLPVDAFEPGA